MSVTIHERADTLQAAGFKTLEENCGVFGLVGVQNASKAAFFALYALNHRGQESAGIASYDSHGMHVHKGMGLVSQVFDEEDMQALKGSTAIGHTRYSTAGGSKLAGAQPFVLETDLGQLAIAHNGQVAQQHALRKGVLSRGVGLFSTSDTELIAQMLARPHNLAEAMALAEEDEEQGNRETLQQGKAGAAAGAAAAAGSSAATTTRSLRKSWDGAPLWACWVTRIAAFMRECEGAYALVVLSPDGVYGVRDPYGLRPLCIGRATQPNPDGTRAYFLSSESCAFGTVGAEYVREVLPGEVVHIDPSLGVRSWLPLAHPAKGSGRAALVTPSPSFCVFEYVYFARPDSLMEGQMVHSVRTRLGAALAKEAPPPPTADLVSGVPDSSVAAAIGYAQVSGLPFSEVLCKNRYIGRTFIKPDDSMRKNAIQLKYNPLTAVLAGRSVVLVDDSLVRGNTLRQLVPLLRQGGAKEVHIRISSPPIRHPCYYGVDIGTYEELIATSQPSVEAIRAYIGADSLAYLSHDGMMGAVRAGATGAADADAKAAAAAAAAPGASASASSSEGGAGAGGAGAADAASTAGRLHCSACFTGVYPIPFDAPPSGCC